MPSGKRTHALDFFILRRLSFFSSPLLPFLFLFLPRSPCSSANPSSTICCVVVFTLGQRTASRCARDFKARPLSEAEVWWGGSQPLPSLNIVSGPPRSPIHPHAPASSILFIQPSYTTALHVPTNCTVVHQATSRCHRRPRVGKSEKKEEKEDEEKAS